MFEEHLTSLSNLLNKLAEVDLTIRLIKCLLAFDKLEFMGHVAAWEESGKAQKCTQAPNQGSFVSLCEFYQTYTKDVNSIAVPLTDVTRKGAPDKVCMRMHASL